MANVVTNMSDNVLNFFHAGDPSSIDGVVYMEEIFKQDGISKNNEEVSITVKPGKYRVQVTNTSRNILKNIRLSIRVTCDQFSDQTEDISKGQSWSTVVKAPFEVTSSVIKVVCKVDQGNNDAKCPYSIQVCQQYSITYSQTGVVGNKETNDYETPILPPGQYVLLAKSANNTPYQLSLACGTVMENNSEVKANRMYRSPQVLIRHEDKDETAAIRVTGTRAKEAEFELYFLQSISAFEMKRLEDGEKKKFIEQHRGMLEDLFESEELEQIGLVCDIIQQRGDGYGALTNYGLNLQELLSNILNLKKQVTQFCASGGDLASMKEVLMEMDECSSKTNLKFEIAQERMQLQKLIDTVEKQDELVTRIQQSITDGKLEELQNDIAELEILDASAPKRKKVSSVIDKAKLSVSHLVIVSDITNRMNASIESNKADLISKIQKEIQSQQNDYIRKLLTSVSLKGSNALEHMKKQVEASKELKNLVLSKQATSLGLYLNQNREFIAPQLLSITNALLNNMLRNQPINTKEFLEVVSQIEKYQEYDVTDVLDETVSEDEQSEKDVNKILDDILDGYDSDDQLGPISNDLLDGYESEENIDILDIIDQAQSDDEIEETKLSTSAQERDRDLLKKILEDDLSLIPQFKNSKMNNTVGKRNSIPLEESDDDSYSEELNAELTDEEDEVSNTIEEEIKPVDTAPKAKLSSSPPFTPNTQTIQKRKSIRSNSQIGKIPIQKKKIITSSTALNEETNETNELDASDDYEEETSNVIEDKSIEIPSDEKPTPKQRTRNSVTKNKLVIKSRRESTRSDVPSTEVENTHQEQEENIVSTPEETYEDDVIVPTQSTEPETQNLEADTNNNEKKDSENNLVEHLKEAQMSDLVRKFKKGYVPLQLQRKNQLSHQLLDRLHMLLLQMIHANQDNLVTGETPFALPLVKVLHQILSYKTKNKMFFRERTVYDVFCGYEVPEIRGAIRYFELHDFAARDSFNPPSVVWLQFILESGDFMKFMYMLIHDETYLDTCYDKLSIIHNKFYRDDLISELMLLSQVRFWFGFLSKPLSKEEQPSKEELLEQLRNTTKDIVQFFIDNKRKNENIEFKELGDEHKTREIGSLVRYNLYPVIESICNHDMQIKHNCAGPYHIWNLIEAYAKQLSQASNRSPAEDKYLHAVIRTMRTAVINESDYMYRDGIRFTCFVCLAMNDAQLVNYLTLCLKTSNIKRFYDGTAIMNDEDLRSQFFQYLQLLTQLPFTLKLH